MAREQGPKGEPIPLADLLVDLMMMTPGVEVAVKWREKTIYFASYTKDEVTGDNFFNLRGMSPEYKSEIMRGMPFEDLGGGLFGLNISQMRRDQNKRTSRA